MLDKLLDVQHPFFVPLWRRVATVAVCFGWCIAEVVMGGPFWALIFGALGLYCSYQFFVVFNPKMPDEKKDKDNG